MLRDLVHAEITFKELARITGLGEKSLHRMLSRHGNPKTDTLGKIVVGIREALGYIPQISVYANQS
jgi:DNA-binding phage protein